MRFDAANGSVQAVASLLVFTNLVVGEADTTAGSITVSVFGCTRRTTDFPVGNL